MKISKRILYLLGGLIGSLILCSLYLLILKYLSARSNNQVLSYEVRSRADDILLFVAVIGPLLLLAPVGYSLSKAFFEYFFSENRFNKIKNIIIVINIVLAVVAILWLFSSASGLLKTNDYLYPLIFAGVAIVLLLSIGWARFFAYRRFQAQSKAPQPLATQIKESVARVAIHGMGMTSSMNKIGGIYAAVLAFGLMLFILIYQGPFPYGSGSIQEIKEMSLVVLLEGLIIVFLNASMLTYIGGVFAQWRVPVPIFRLVCKILFIPNLVLSFLVLGMIMLSGTIYGQVFIFIAVNFLIIFFEVLLMKKIRNWIVKRSSS